MPVILATWEAEIRIVVRSQPQAVSSRDFTLKNTQHKKAGGADQVIEHLHSKCEALSSNSRTDKKKKKKSVLRKSNITYSKVCSYYLYFVL
jgi:hypothetical protein